MTNNGMDKITPEPLYHSRRKFLKLVGMVGVSAALAACGIKPTSENAADDLPEGTETTSGTTTLPEDSLTPYDLVTEYNNFYEFSLGKEDVAAKAAGFNATNWTVEIGGLVDRPMTVSVDELVKSYPPEERVYRMRCVEGWSMVIPWNGFPLHRLLADIGVQADAKYVRFTTPYDRDMFPNQGSFGFAWPYTEGLRLDEAQHDLTLLATGLYGKDLPAQDGAPIRLVVPWKYGFKSIKSISKIELVADQPDTFWSSANPGEYGFYSNVNPDVPHPRWSQSTERRIGELGRRPTGMFNGYSEVAPLYEGMDLAKYY